MTTHVIGPAVKKKFLVCGIQGAERRNVSSFFVSRNGGDLSFCEALVSGEGEAKTLLSTYEIDEIIVIGDASLLGAKGMDAAGERIALNEGFELMTSDVRGLSGFDFFRYRMTQYTMGVQIDLADSLGELESARREELYALARSLFGDDLSLALPTLFSSKELRAKFEERMAGCPLEDYDWLFRFLFCDMNARNRMAPKGGNAAVPISFVPISASYGFEDLTLFQNLIESLVTESGAEAELYVDLHGLPSEASAVCSSTLYSLSDDANTNIHVIATASVCRAELPSFYEIDMSQRHYRIDKLMAGIRAFLNNGKTDILRSYWDEAKRDNPTLKNEYVDQILMAMGYVDAGISLCNTEELTTGILALRRLLNHPEQAPAPSQQEDTFVVMMVRESVLRDYGALMDEDSDELDPFELVKWGYSKKFYQQVITIIESLIPAQIIARGILYPAASEEEVLAYEKAVNVHYWDGLPSQRWMFKDLDHYFIKFYGRFAVDYRSRAVPPNTQYTRARVSSVFDDSLEKINLLPAHSLLGDKELLGDLLERYYDLSTFRNTVNHAENHDNSVEELASTSPVWKRAGELIGGFIECYGRVLEVLGDNRPDDIKPLVSSEFKDYFFEHGPKNDPEYNTAVGYTPSNRARPRRRFGDGNGAFGNGTPAGNGKPAFGNGASAGNGGNGKPAGGNGGRGRGGRGHGGRGGAPKGGFAGGPGMPPPAPMPAGENVCVNVSMPKSTLDELRADKSKKGEVVVRISLE